MGTAKCHYSRYLTLQSLPISHKRCWIDSRKAYTLVATNVESCCALQPMSLAKEAVHPGKIYSLYINIYCFSSCQMYRNNNSCMKKKTSHGCKLGRVFSDVALANQGFGSVQHHTPQASSGDPAEVDRIPTYVPVTTLDQSD